MRNASVAFGYASLGLLIGILSGLSSGPIAGALLAAMFTFVGGSVAYLLDRKPEERHLLGVVLSSFAALCTIGLLVGIVIKDNRLLSFRSVQRPRVNESVADSDSAIKKPSQQPCEGSVYFKGAEIDAIDAIDLQLANREISAEKAYRQLWAQLTQARQAGARNSQRPQSTEASPNPGATSKNTSQQPCEGSVYFKDAELNAIDAIDLQYSNREISAEKAYGQLWVQLTQARQAGAGR
jgi:hypothetical protein